MLAVGWTWLECQYGLAWWRTWQEEGTMEAMTIPDVWSGQDRTLTRLAVILSAACPAEFAILAGVGVNITKFQHRVPDEYRAAVPFPVAIVPSELVTAG